MRDRSLLTFAIGAIALPEAARIGELDLNPGHAQTNPPSTPDPPWVRWRRCSLDSNRVAGLRLVTVGGFVLGRWDVVEVPWILMVLNQVTEPRVASSTSSTLFRGLWPGLRISSALCNVVTGFGQGVVVAAADRADRGQRTELGEPFPVPVEPKPGSSGFAHPKIVVSAVRPRP